MLIKIKIYNLLFFEKFLECLSLLSYSTNFLHLFICFYSDRPLTSWLTNMYLQILLSYSLDILRKWEFCLHMQYPISNKHHPNNHKMWYPGWWCTCEHGHRCCSQNSWLVMGSKYWGLVLLLMMSEGVSNKGPYTYKFAFLFHSIDIIADGIKTTDVSVSVIRFDFIPIVLSSFNKNNWIWLYINTFLLYPYDITIIEKIIRFCSKREWWWNFRRYWSWLSVPGDWYPGYSLCVNPFHHC